MHKKLLSERDICSKFITPALEKAGWDMQRQVREEVSFTDGRIIVQGKLYARGKRKRADYILYYKPNIPVTVVQERVQYYGADGKLITESLKDYTRKNLQREFSSLDAFLRKWHTAAKKAELVQELAEHGILLDALKKETGKNLDPFDLICHLAFDQPALTRKERADQVRKRNFFTKYGDSARKILESLLDKYENEGVFSIEEGSVLNVVPLSQMGSPVELVRAFGKNADFEQALRELQHEIYKSA